MKPFRYHRISSLKAVRGAIIGVIVGSVATTLLLVSTADQDPELLETWPMCIYSWNTDSTAHLVIIVSTAVFIFFGLILFIYCNSSLVIILWRYHKEKAKSVLAELSNAVKALNNTENEKNKKMRTKCQNDDGACLKIKVTETTSAKENDVLTTPMIILHAAENGDDEETNKIIPVEHPLAQASIVILNEKKCVPFGCETKLYTKQKSTDSQRSTKSILKREKSLEKKESTNMCSNDTILQSSQVQLIEHTPTTQVKYSGSISSKLLEDNKNNKGANDTVTDNISPGKRHGPRGFGHILKKTMSADIIKTKIFHKIENWSPNTSMNTAEQVHVPLKKMSSLPSYSELHIIYLKCGFCMPS